MKPYDATSSEKASMVPAMETLHIWTAFCRAKLKVIGTALVDSKMSSRRILCALGSSRGE